MKSVNENTCFCWYLIFIVNHRKSSLKPVFGCLWETQEQTEANILHVQTEKPVKEEN